jgi:hypothetical protein
MTLKQIANNLPREPNLDQLVQALQKAYGEGIEDSIKTIQAAAETLDDGEVKAAVQAIALGLTVGKNFLVEIGMTDRRTIAELREHADKVPGYGHLVAHEMVDEIERLRLKVAYYHTSTCPKDDCQECADSEALIKTSPLPEE